MPRHITDTIAQKKTPCEGCRDQKRKCNGQNPCERCYKFNLRCVYTSTRSPRDEEYIEIARAASLVSQMKFINNQIREMEISIQDLSKSRNFSTTSIKSGSMPSMVFDDSDKSSTEEDVNSVAGNVSLFHTSSEYQPGPPLKRTKIIAYDRDMCAYIAPFVVDKKDQLSQGEVSPWTLTFQKGNMCIETHVKTHSELLNNLHHMVSSVKLSNSIPSIVKSSVKEHTVIGVLNTLIRKKYGKIHCKNVAKSVRIFIAPEVSTVDTMIVARAPETMQTTSLKLIRAYIRCQHLQQLAIHARTFFKLFIDGRNVEESPAAMALCAVICTMRCKHIASCLASISLVEYGKFYFERARDLLSDSFDQCDLEALTSYTFMAIYMLAVSHAEESLIYSDMAERIAIVLEPHYSSVLKQQPKNNGDDEVFLIEKGKAVHFQRIRNHLHRVQTYEQISRLVPAEEMKVKQQDLPFCTLIHLGEGQWIVADDDSVQEKWFAQMHTFILYLQREERGASRSARANDLQHLVGLIAHQVEMAMRHWYFKILPPEFRLTLPLFGSDVNSEEYYATLERECAHSAIPALTTLALYEEWLVLGQSYLPKRKAEPENDWGLLNKIWNGGHVPKGKLNNKWTRRIQKLMELREAIEFEGTDQEYLVAINHMLTASDHGINVPLIINSLHAAFNAIRLIKFLRSRSADCYFDMRILLSAWHMLLRVSRLQCYFPPEITSFLPRVHKNLSECMTIVKEELKLQPYQGTLGGYATQMEKDLKKEIVDDEEEEDNCDYKKELDKCYMRIALDYALLHNPKAPFGALIVDHTTNEISCYGVNSGKKNKLLHGETAAFWNCTELYPSPTQDDKSNPGLNWAHQTLYTTGEPCPMCASQSIYRGVTRVVWGTSIDDLNKSGIDQIKISMPDVVNSARKKADLPNTDVPVLEGGVLKEECDHAFWCAFVNARDDAYYTTMIKNGNLDYIKDREARFPCNKSTVHEEL
ncbi:hypothetical protein CU098_006378 [Rhizopus stolonifer]|uniref:CMP/dCMP-type deaminase domain-containing protein n=1 Tax=Rhizopus stolonifer TaxID=4846 RepID=A0A367KQ44_RHIST|nr:hypothetical protein CU098_006378 [Rhizopus stolonifer]